MLTFLSDYFDVSLYLFHIKTNQLYNFSNPYFNREKSIILLYNDKKFEILCDNKMKNIFNSKEKFCKRLLISSLSPYKINNKLNHDHNIDNSAIDLFKNYYIDLEKESIINLREIASIFNIPIHRENGLKKIKAEIIKDIEKIRDEIYV